MCPPNTKSNPNTQRSSSALPSKNPHPPNHQQHPEDEDGVSSRNVGKPSLLTLLSATEHFIYHLTIFTFNSLPYLQTTFAIRTSGYWLATFRAVRSYVYLSPSTSFLPCQYHFSKYPYSFIPTFYETRRSITAFTSARHLSQSWTSSIHSIPPNPTSWRCLSILSSHLCLDLPSDLFPSCFPTKILYMPFISPIRATYTAHLILLDFITWTILGEQ